MDKTHKIIIALLIIAILFFVISIIINFSISNLTLPKQSTGSPGDAGSVKLYVEESKNVRGGG